MPTAPWNPDPSEAITVEELVDILGQLPCETRVWIDQGSWGESPMTRRRAEDIVRCAGKGTGKAPGRVYLP